MENNTTATKEWANPTPAGLVALAVACFLFFALLTGRVEKSAMPILGSYLIGGFFIQFVVALLDLKGGNLSGGNTFLYFSAYFMLVSGAGMFLKYFVPGMDTRIDGWAWMVLALTLALWTPAFYKGPALLFGIVLGLNVALPCIVVSDLKLFAPEIGKIFGETAGYALLACGILGIYLAAALVLNGSYGKTVLPNPAPLYGRKKRKQ